MNFLLIMLALVLLVGIGSVSASEKTSNAPSYTLQGIQITHPQKGLYIQNGKKVVIK